MFVAAEKEIVSVNRTLSNFAARRTGGGGGALSERTRTFTVSLDE